MILGVAAAAFLAKLSVVGALVAGSTAAYMDNKTPTKQTKFNDAKKAVVESKSTVPTGYLGNDGVWHLS